MARKDWSSEFWYDLGERVGATCIGALITMLTADTTGKIPSEPSFWWIMIGLPTVLAFLKGVGANFKNPESGPSLLPAPPAPEVGEDGAVDTLVLLGVAILIGVVLILFGVRLG